MKAFDPAVNELIILAGHAIRQLISQVYQTLKQKMPELVQRRTMVITGALQTIRNVWPDVLATIIDLLWRLLLAIVRTPQVHRGVQDDARESNPRSRCVPPNGRSDAPLLQAMLDGITERVPGR